MLLCVNFNFLFGNLGGPYCGGDAGHYHVFISEHVWNGDNVQDHVPPSYWFVCLYLCYVFIMEIVIVFGIVYMSSYGSMLVVWCILGIYLVSCNMLQVLMMLIFYGGLVVVSILIVMPNGNAHHYYYCVLGLMVCSLGVGLVYVDLLIASIVLLTVIM